MTAKFLREQLQLFLIATSPTLEVSKRISQLTIYGLEKKRKATKKRVAVTTEADIFDKKKRVGVRPR